MKIGYRILNSLNLFSFAHVVAKSPTIRRGVRHDYLHWPNQFQNLGGVLTRQSRCLVRDRNAELTYCDCLKWHRTLPRMSRLRAGEPSSEDLGPARIDHRRYGITDMPADVPAAAAGGGDSRWLGKNAFRLIKVGAARAE